MTDPGGTEPLSRDDVEQQTPAMSGPRGALDDPVEAAKDPDNRAKLLLAIAAIGVLNLVLLLAVLASVAGGGAEVVEVEGRPCIIQDHDGSSQLFCSR